MRVLGVLAVGLGACGYPRPADVTDLVDTPADQSFDAAVDGLADARACFGSGAFSVCLNEQPTAPIDLSGTNDTDISELCLMTLPPSWTNTQGDACIVVATAITIPSGQTARFIGGRPVVLVATGLLAIDGTLDLASKGTGGRGAGSSPGIVECSSTSGNSSGGKGGGGGGGSFGGAGADGGSANSVASTAGVAGPAEASPHDVLRGGCRAGGGAQGTDNASAGGHGGGAVFLVGDTVAITGTINASGAGGGQGDAGKGGGGGGGAGGMIVIDGGAIAITGTLVANGGGGGGGAEASNNGGLGGDPIATTASTPALGGFKGLGGPAGPGGDGAAASISPTGGTGLSDGGGGGGGGGIGVIRVLSGALPIGAQISPAATN